MSSKSTSLRNERILTELRSREGNDVCADCGTRQPRWASWTLGIWLCVKCATIHRRMGTHISRVKSASLDIWTKEQVEAMRDMGNIKSNLIYNPNPKLHPPPLDLESEHAESQLERYIFQKYRDKAFMEKPKKKSSTRPSTVDSSSSLSADNSSSVPFVATKTEGGARYQKDVNASNGLRTPAVSIATPPDPAERAFSPPTMPLATQQPASHLSAASASPNARAMTAPLPDQASRSFSPSVPSSQNYNPFHRQMTASAQIPSMTGMPSQVMGMVPSAGLAPYQQQQQPTSSISYQQNSLPSPYGQTPVYKPAVIPRVQPTAMKGEVWQDLAGLSLSSNGLNTQQPLSSSFNGYQASNMPMMQTNPFLQSSIMSAKAPSQISSMSSGSSFSSLGSASSAGFSPNYTQANIQNTNMPSYQYQATQNLSAPSLIGNPYMNSMQQQPPQQSQQQTMMSNMSMQPQQQLSQMTSQQQQPYQFHSTSPYASQLVQLQQPYPQYVQNQYQMM